MASALRNARNTVKVTATVLRKARAILEAIEFALNDTRIIIEKGNRYKKDSICPLGCQNHYRNTDLCIQECKVHCENNGNHSKHDGIWASEGQTHCKTAVSASKNARKAVKTNGYLRSRMCESLQKQRE